MAVIYRRKLIFFLVSYKLLTWAGPFVKPSEACNSFKSLMHSIFNHSILNHKSSPQHRVLKKKSCRSNKHVFESNSQLESKLSEGLYPTPSKFCCEETFTKSASRSDTNMNTSTCFCVICWRWELPENARSAPLEAESSWNTGLLSGLRIWVLRKGLTLALEFGAKALPTKSTDRNRYPPYIQSDIRHQRTI